MYVLFVPLNCVDCSDNLETTNSLHLRKYIPAGDLEDCRCLYVWWQTPRCRNYENQHDSTHPLGSRDAHMDGEGVEGTQRIATVLKPITNPVLSSIDPKKLAHFLGEWRRYESVVFKTTEGSPVSFHCINPSSHRSRHFWKYAFHGMVF